MKQSIKQFLFWAPRILCILFAGFLSIFALDVFGEGYGFWKTVLALLMHLIPAGIVLIVLAISWQWEWVGAVVFIAMGLYYLLTTLNHSTWILGIAGPLFLIGILFLMNGLCKKETLTSR
jgi:hypothetical protein